MNIEIYKLKCEIIFQKRIKNFQYQKKGEIYNFKHNT